MSTKKSTSSFVKANKLTAKCKAVLAVGQLEEYEMGLNGFVCNVFLPEFVHSWLINSEN